jgi:hypothetical protein
MASPLHTARSSKRSIERDIQVLTQRLNTFGMIAVLMSDKGSFQSAVFNTRFSQTLEHGASGKTTVNQQRLRIALNECGITTTATA